MIWVSNQAQQGKEGQKGCNEVFSTFNVQGCVSTFIQHKWQMKRVSKLRSSFCLLSVSVDLTLVRQSDGHGHFI